MLAQRSANFIFLLLNIPWIWLLGMDCLSAIEVNTTHTCNLAFFSLIISLVDADGIHPERPFDILRKM